MKTRKVCLLGAFAVGKTSLVRRFVHGAFDERYLTTLGVKIDTKSVEVGGQPVKLVVWDIEGTDPGEGENAAALSRQKAYLQGTDGVLLVADLTRASTLEVAQKILGELRHEKPGVPAILMLNKADLADQRQIDPRQLSEISGLSQSFTTSALSGENVEDTFVCLAELLTERDGAA